MAGVEKHQSSGGAIRRMLFNVARKERFFKRISGKNRKFRMQRLFSAPKPERSFFPWTFFGKHIEKNGISRLILALFAVILLE